MGKPAASAENVNDGKIAAGAAANDSNHLGGMMGE